MEEPLFHGKADELFVGDGERSAEERLKSLLGESDRGGLIRRRIVRRPLSSGSYVSQSLNPPHCFSERERPSQRERDNGSPSLRNADPLSDLLSHLAASRKAHEAPMMRLREASLAPSFYTCHTPFFPSISFFEFHNQRDDSTARCLSGVALLANLLATEESSRRCSGCSHTKSPTDPPPSCPPLTPPPHLQSLAFLLFLCSLLGWMALSQVVASGDGQRRSLKWTNSCC